MYYFHLFKTSNIRNDLFVSPCVQKWAVFEIQLELVRRYDRPFLCCWHQLANTVITRMWANAQPDGRPAEHRWRPPFNASKFR